MVFVLLFCFVVHFNFFDNGVLWVVCEESLWGRLWGSPPGILWGSPWESLWGIFWGSEFVGDPVGESVDESYCEFVGKCLDESLVESEGESVDVSVGEAFSLLLFSWPRLD